MAPRICVIGSGICGLVSLKACLEENFDVVCYEKTKKIGGLWRYRDEDIDGLGSVMRSTVIDTSKEMSALSDFPPKAEYANFMHNTSVLKYFEDYAEHFDLLKHIRFEHEVLEVKRRPDFKTTGQWDVKVKCLKDNQIQEEVFDGVMIANGHHVYQYMPDFEGLDKFKGIVMHSHSYKNHVGFEDKRILVIGIGNSGCDITVELGKTSNHVYMCARRGSWIISRVGTNGIPWDIHVARRSTNLIFSKFLPKSVTNSYFERKVTEKVDHDLYGLKPQHRFFAQHPTVADDLPNRILCGAVTIKGEIDHFTPEGVVFKGEDKVYEIDAVIMATGYNIRFPFLEPGLVATEKNDVRLYKFVFPPDLEKPTLAIIGLCQPHGAIFPLAEMQTRWVTRIFGGKCSLPSPQEMKDEIEEIRRKLQEQYVWTQRHSLEANFIEYMDDVATKIGVKPNLLRLAITDPKLWYHCVFGPCVAYQYRLHGHHPWDGARKAILSVKDRIHKPLLTKAGQKLPVDKSYIHVLMIAALIVFYIAYIITKLF